jgi:ABC-type transport system substrate-binding protein
MKKVTTQPVPASSSASLREAKELAEAAYQEQWDIVQLQWDAHLDPDETLFLELHSTETWNAGRWINPEFDWLVELAQVEADQKKRKQY